MTRGFAVRNIMIKFIKNPSLEPFNMAYGVGVEVELDPKIEQELIEAGVAEEVEKPKKGKKEAE